MRSKQRRAWTGVVSCCAWVALAATGELDAERLAPCRGAAAPVLNEVCAVGTECDEDVRIADFVELYNPHPRAVPLGCFALSSEAGVLFLPHGEIAARAHRAWGEAELGWRIQKGGDEVRLLRLRLGSAGEPETEIVESVTVTPGRAHLIRSPDGGTWRQLSADEAEQGFPGSFGEANPALPEDP